jgi:hypothetical protein
VIVRLVAEREGPASAAVAEHWWRRIPRSWWVIRGPNGAVDGVVCMLDLGDVCDPDRLVDPALDPVTAYGRRYGPPRTGDAMLFNRFAVIRGDDRGAGAFAGVSMVNTVRWLSTDRLAWSFVSVSEPDRWRDYFSYLHMPYAADAGFDLGGRRFEVSAHDWRAEPVSAWLDSLVAQELSVGRGDWGASDNRPPPLLVLSEPDFAAAVLDGLRHFTQTAALARNPLLRSRLVRDVSKSDASASTLKEVLESAARGLAATPRGERHYRAVLRTYLRPAPTQERAAEVLGVPFSTYRYHLTKGVEQITANLWERELTSGSRSD